jgi:LacI family transcriptional regulator
MAVIKDVAQLAGLSVSVVSKYLNYPDNVSEDTKLRVEAAIKELNYAPSLTARSMRTKRSQMIAIIVPDIMDAFYTDVFNSVKQYALAKGYTPILYTIENDIELLKDYLAKVSTKLFDGLMLCFLEEDELLEMYDELQAELPVVMLSGAAADNRFSAVITDLFEGSYIATKHLISSGCKRIACICGPKGRKTTDEKKAGYAKAVKEAGLEVMEEYLYYGPYRYQTGYEAGVKFFRLPKMPDGVCAANDVIAAGLIKYVLNRGILIPDDIKVVGFDNVQLASIYHPGISTIHVPVRQMCKKAVNMLIKSIENKDKKKHKAVLTVRR